MVEDSILTSLFVFVTSIEAAPVEVNVAVSGLGTPYSVGFLNCFSLAKLWEEVDTIHFMTFLPSIKLDAIISPSLLVAQALNIPKKGISKLLNA